MTPELSSRVVSQLPVKYTLSKLSLLEYKLHKDSQLSLIIECISEGNCVSPINYYFKFAGDIISLDDLFVDRFFKEDFNVFLSVLN